MRRHISFCILTIVCQTTAILNYLDASDVVKLPGWVQALCIYYFCIVALILAVLRLHEPIVLSTFKRDISGIFCSSRVDNDRSLSGSSLRTSEGSDLSTMDMRNSKGCPDSDMLSDTLSAFLTSSLNVELVYTILKGIRRIVKTPDLESQNNG